MNEIENKVLDYSKTQQIEYEKIDIDPNFSDTENFCKKYNFSLDQSANTIILESKRPKGIYSIAVVQASKKLDVNTKLKNIMGVKKLSFANAAKSEELTGMKVGGITPFGLSQKLQIYTWASFPKDEFRAIASAGIIVLLVILLTMNSLAIYIRWKNQTDNY